MVPCYRKENDKFLKKYVHVFCNGQKQNGDAFDIHLHKHAFITLDFKASLRSLFHEKLLWKKTDYGFNCTSCFGSMHEN